MHESLSFFVSGQEQHIFFLGLLSSCKAKTGARAVVVVASIEQENALTKIKKTRS